MRWILSEDQANFDAVRDDGEVLVILDVGGHRKNSGAGVHKDRVAILNRIRCPASDSLLRLSVHLNVSRKGGAGKSVTLLQYRTAAHASESSGFFKRTQIVADRSFRDARTPGQLADPDAWLPPKEVENALPPFKGGHAPACL